MADSTLANLLATCQRIERTQTRILARLAGIEITEVDAMSLQQDILDAITAETNAVDAVVLFIQNLVANNTITSEAGQQILAALASDKDKLNAAISANLE